jgi:peptide/nickel transport system permease protein
MVLHIAIAAAVVILLSLIIRRLTRRSVPLWLQIPMMAGIAFGIWNAQTIVPYVLDLLESAALPLITYVLLIFGETMVIMQTSMQETIKEEYMVTARAKGLPDRLLRDKHAARNALLPVLSRFFISLPYLLGGIVIIEDSVNWPGMGAAMVGSLYWQDMPVVMGFLLFIGAMSLMIRLGLDVLAAYMDPRIRFNESHRLPTN